MAINEEEVIVAGPASLGATVAYPSKEGRRPAIVIIMGTGKLDRDGNGPGSRMNIYRDLSDLFVEEGFVTIRYDKRGTHRSSGDFSSAGLSDLVDDAVSVTEYVKSLPYVDAGRVVVCGHSEGTMVATLLSEREDVAGLMLLGGAATCMKDALRYQSRLMGEQSEGRKGITGALLRRAASQEKTDARQDELFERCLSTDEDTIRFQGVKICAKWMREHLSYSSEDYAGMLRGFGKPILAVTGTADLSADFRSLDSIKDIPTATCYAPEGVNHILREIDDDNSMTKVKKQYLRLSARPIHPGTRQIMVEWLSQFSGRGHGEAADRFPAPHVKTTRDRFLRNSTVPSRTSYMAPATTMSCLAERSSDIRRTLLRTFSLEASAGSLSSPMQARMLSMISMECPSCNPFRASAMAPQRVWPMTTTTLTPMCPTAYSRLPRVHPSTTLPAERITNRSPIPAEKTASGITRESEQETTAAKGRCPSSAARTLAACDTSPEKAPLLTYLLLPSFSVSMTRSGS